MVVGEGYEWGSLSPKKLLSRNTLSKPGVVFLCRTLASNYFLLPYVDCGSESKVSFALLSLSFSFILSNENCFLQLNIGHKSFILIINAMITLCNTVENHYGNKNITRRKDRPFILFYINDGQVKDT